MIALSGEELLRRANGFVARLEGVRAEIVEGSSVVGGGATPQRELKSWVIAVECGDVVEVERRLRGGDPAVVARIEDGRLMVDLRTVFPAEEDHLVSALILATDEHG